MKVVFQMMSLMLYTYKLLENNYINKKRETKNNTITSK